MTWLPYSLSVVHTRSNYLKKTYIATHLEPPSTTASAAATAAVVADGGGGVT